MHLVATFHRAVKSLSGKGDISHHIYRHRRQEVLAGRGRASRVRRGGGKAVVQQCRKLGLVFSSFGGREKSYQRLAGIIGKLIRGDRQVRLIA